MSQDHARLTDDERADLHLRAEAVNRHALSLFIDDPTPTSGVPARSLQGVVPAEAPTTGGPVDYELPTGCVCHIREDIDKGDVFVAPPEGCRVHTPWAFPGYSLTQETETGCGCGACSCQGAP